MKILVAYSGGKDSQACLIMACKKFGPESVQAVFCDTGWEHELTYKHIQETTLELGCDLVTLRSSKYFGFMDLVERKKRFPSAKARFCTEELKTKPMIDYILTLRESVLVFQGIRADESEARSKMAKQCTFFKFYLQPYGTDKNGKPKFNTYRKKEVLAFIAEHGDDIERPVLDWTATQVLTFILENGQKPNPLYYQGFGRVGCFPCVLCNRREVKQIQEKYPERLTALAGKEASLNTTFFAPNFLPKGYRLGTDSKSGKRIVRIPDVQLFLSHKDTQTQVFEEPETQHGCMSFYQICG